MAVSKNKSKSLVKIIVGHAVRGTTTRPEARYFGPTQARPGPIYRAVLGLLLRHAGRHGTAEENPRPGTRPGNRLTGQQKIMPNTQPYLLPHTTRSSIPPHTHHRPTSTSASGHRVPSYSRLTSEGADPPSPPYSCPPPRELPPPLQCSISPPTMQIRRRVPPAMRFRRP